jgi:hypothetical protein
MGKKRGRKRTRQSAITPAIIIGAVSFTILFVGGLLWVLLKKDRSADSNSAQSVTSSGSSSELAKAIAETEKTDPQWRLADIAAARTKLDPDKNGAPLALSAARQISQNAITSLDGFDTRRIPSQPIPDSEVVRLRNTLRSCGPALTEARKIAFTPQGRFEINFNFDKPLDTLLDHAQNTRKTAWLLIHDSQLRSADRDAAGALQSVSATLNLARYFDDEPFAISQLVRIAIHMLAVGALERALTCSVIPDDSLKTIQEQLESAAAANTMVLTFRGERANYHATIECKNYQNTNLSDADHAWAIRAFHRAIELAKRSPPYYSDEWISLMNDVERGPPAATRIMPHFGKFRDAFARQTAVLRTAALAIAAERYRRDKGEWPKELKLLAPAYIKTVPTDPYFGGPISHGRSAAGFSIFVKGNAPFANGEFNSIGSGPDLCQGFRLLNPELRR